MSGIRRRNWVLDPVTIADQLDVGYRNTVGGLGYLDAVETLVSWHAAAADRGERFTDDDWMALALELACRAAGDDA
jgi:hypothetical protein